MISLRELLKARGLARCVSVFRRVGRLDPGSRRLSRDFPYPDMPVSHCFFYQLERDPRFTDLERRLVFRWQGQERAWCQVFRDNEIVEVLPAGHAMPFPGY